MNVQAVLEQMQYIAENTQIIQLHRADDMAIDKKILDADFAKQYVWLQRSTGTELLPVGCGVAPYKITDRLDPDSPSYDRNARPYLLQGNQVIPISVDRATKLANVVPALDKEANYFSVCHQVQDFLEKTRVLRGTFSTPTIDKKDWHGWLKFFENEPNALMVRYMKQAIRQRTEKAGKVA